MLGARNRLIMLAVEAEEGAKPEEAETLHNESSTHIFLPMIQRWGTALYVIGFLNAKAYLIIPRAVQDGP